MPEVAEIFVQMSRAEAEAITFKAKAYTVVAYRLLTDLKRRRGYAALGYATFAEYVEKELGKSRGHAYRLLDQARVVAAVEQAVEEALFAGLQPHELEALASPAGDGEPAGQGEMNHPAPMSPAGDIYGLAGWLEIPEREARDLKPVLDEVLPSVRAAVENLGHAAQPAAIKASVERVLKAERLARMKAVPPAECHDAGPDPMKLALDGLHRAVRDAEANRPCACRWRASSWTSPTTTVSVCWRSFPAWPTDSVRSRCSWHRLKSGSSDLVSSSLTSFGS